VRNGVAERAGDVAGLVEWDAGMFRWAAQGGRGAESEPEENGLRALSRGTPQGSDWSKTNSGTGSASAGSKAAV